MFNEEQLHIIGWVLSIGISLFIGCVSALTVYCIYVLFRLVKNFSKRY